MRTKILIVIESGMVMEVRSNSGLIADVAVLDLDAFAVGDQPESLPEPPGGDAIAGAYEHSYQPRDAEAEDFKL